jgi:hypothetical protein
MRFRHSPAIPTVNDAAVEAGSGRVRWGGSRSSPHSRNHRFTSKPQEVQLDAKGCKGGSDPGKCQRSSVHAIGPSSTGRKPPSRGLRMRGRGVPCHTGPANGGEDTRAVTERGAQSEKAKGSRGVPAGTGARFRLWYM